MQKPPETSTCYLDYLDLQAGCILLFFCWSLLIWFLHSAPSLMGIIYWSLVGSASFFPRWFGCHKLGCLSAIIGRIYSNYSIWHVYIYIHMSRLVYIPFYLSSLWLSKKICLTPIVCWWNHIESLHGFFCQRGCEAGGLLRCWLSALCWRKPKIVGWLALNLFCASTRSARSFKSAIFWYNGEYKGNMFFLRVFKQIHVFRFCLDF